MRKFQVNFDQLNRLINGVLNGLITSGGLTKQQIRELPVEFEFGRNTYVAKYLVKFLNKRFLGSFINYNGKYRLNIKPNNDLGEITNDYYQYLTNLINESKEVVDKSMKEIEKNLEPDNKFKLGSECYCMEGNKIEHGIITGMCYIDADMNDIQYTVKLTSANNKMVTLFEFEVFHSTQDLLNFLISNFKNRTK